MPDRDQLKLELKVVLTIVAMIAGVIGAHFTGIESARGYTDKKVSDLKTEITSKLSEIGGDVKEISKALTRIETIQDNGNGKRAPR